MKTCDFIHFGEINGRPTVEIIAYPLYSWFVIKYKIWYYCWFSIKFNLLYKKDSIGQRIKNERKNK